MQGVMMTLVCEYITWGVQDRKGGHDGLGLYASTLPGGVQDKEGCHDDLGLYMSTLPGSVQDK